MSIFDLCGTFQFNFSTFQSPGHDPNASTGNWSPCSALLDIFDDTPTEKDNLAQYHRDLISYYVTGIAGLTIACLGIIGNTLSVIVLTRKAMRSSTYTYLSALAICDTVFLICIILLTTKDLHRPQLGVDSSDKVWENGGGLHSYLFQFVHPVANTLQVTSIWLTLAFTVDRYIVICHPFQSELFCTISRARKVVFGLSLASTIYNLPKFFEYKLARIIHPTRGTIRIRCDLTTFGKTKLFRQLYHSWLYIVFVCGLPFAALAVLNAFLIQAVRLSSGRSREISVVLRRRNDTTVMLISVVIVFFICQTPALISRVIWAHADDTKKFTQIEFYALNEIGNLFVFINSSINFIPYYLFGRRFRRQLKRLAEQCGLTIGERQDCSPSQPVYSFSLTAASRRRPTQEAVEYRRESSNFGYRDSLI